MNPRPPSAPKPVPSGPAPRLLIHPRDGRTGPLYPAQTASFDVVLRNDTAVPLRGKSLSGNLDTPIVRLFGPKGMYGAFDTRARGERIVGETSTLMQTEPSLKTLAPGAEDASWVNLWGYHDPLPPGRYSVDITHRWAPPDEPLASERLVYEIVPVRVTAAAVGYASRLQDRSRVAWLASSKDQPKTARLLLRESGITGHASLNQGGTHLGDFPSDSTIAQSTQPFDAFASALGWIVVIEPTGQTHAILHATTFPQQPAVSFSLGIPNARPIARFPNRGHAVVLATGAKVLAGAVVLAGAEVKAWQVPLAASPLLTACFALQAGGIQILYVAEDGAGSHFHQLEVSETGQVLKADHIVRSTPNRVLALATGQRSAIPTFLALEADRENAKQLSVTQLDRKITTTEMKPLQETIQTVNLEQAPDGAPWIAFTNPAGDIFCGPAAGPISLKHEAHGAPFTFPAVGAVRKKVSCSAFTPSGELYFSEGAHSH